MHRVQRREPLLAPAKAGDNGTEVGIDVRQRRQRMGMLWKNVSVDDLVKVFLIQVIDRETARDRQVQAVGSGNVIIQRDTEKNVKRFCNFRHLAEERPVVASNSGA